MKKQLITIIMMCISSLLIAQTTTENYIQNITYQTPTQNGEVSTLNKIKSITYYDGLGRPKQSIAQKAGGNKEDLITHIPYDILGRQTKQYLPYARNSLLGSGSYISGNIIALVNNQYTTKYAEDFDVEIGANKVVVNPYSEASYESSPLNRVLEQGAPGTDWRINKSSDTDHTVKFEYETNSAAEVWNFDVSYATNAERPTLLLNGRVPANDLYKTITKDENWQPSDGNKGITIEFKNKQGQVILKRNSIKDVSIKSKETRSTYLDTYYIYDDYGNLVYVLSPEGSKQIITNQSLVNDFQEILNKYCYQYRYDHRNRLVSKRIPGKGEELIVYDVLDRPIMTQDANLRTENKWLFTKYDALGRVAYTGIVINPYNRGSKQLVVKSDNSKRPLYETRILNTVSNSTLDTLIYYSNEAFPQGTDAEPLEILTVNYYDTYVDYTGLTLPTQVLGQNTTQHVQVKTTTKGLATVAKVRVLDTNDWITTLIAYDEKGRAIYTETKNTFLNSRDIVSNSLDFTGKPIKTITEHRKSGHSPIITKDYFTYDHMARLRTHSQQINEQPVELIAHNEYDELGQLVNKKVGGQLWETGYKDIVGVSINNNTGTIISTASEGWDNSGTATVGQIGNFGGISFITPIKGDFYMVGLNDVSNDVLSNPSRHADIDYNFYFAGNARSVGYYIRIHNEHFTNLQPYESGDTFAVERYNNAIYFKHNGNVVYTHTISDTVPTNLIGDTSFKTSGSSIENLQFYTTKITEYLEQIDYNYNVRGWLTGINDIKETVTPKLFSFKLNYNKVTHHDAIGLYNGNISETYWKTNNQDTKVRGYHYGYDQLNRITNAISTEGNSLALQSLNQLFNVHGIQYDLNGNIETLKRNGTQTGNELSLWDDLTYSYDGNQLTKVKDEYANPEGFKDGYTGNLPDYEYDVNGNMIRDRNKEITQISYNHLNLPTRISIDDDAEGYIEYTYDALGNKLSKKVYSVDNNNVPVATDYTGGYIYENNELQFFNHPEGYIQPVISSGNEATLSFDYVYQYKDHLGNIRLSYTDSDKDGVITQSEIIEENNYYPFGLKQKGYNNLTSSLGNSVAQNYKFGGKEYNQELGLDWYDVSARNYDPALGRWMNIDPLAEQMRRWSPYNVSFNNPLRFIDPDGMKPQDIIVKDEKQRGAILKMINSRASGEFKFDNSGKLELVKQGSNSSGSNYYTSKLVEGIKSEKTINILIAQKVRLNDKIIDVDKDAGGGLTLGEKGKKSDQIVVISGNENKNIKDVDGNELRDEPADILVHEIVGHAVPNMVVSDTGNAVDNENKARVQYDEQNNCQRACEPNHKESN